MTTAGDPIEHLIQMLNSLYGLPGHILVGISCIVIGYTLRFVRRFPNDALPVVSVLWGAVFTPLVADVRVTGTPLRLWLVRNILVGMIVGGCAWLFHRYFIKRLEDKLPFIGDALADADKRSDEHQVAKITGRTDINISVDGGANGSTVKP